MFILIFFVKIFVCCVYWRSQYSKNFLFWTSFLIAHVQSFVQIFRIRCHKKIQSYAKFLIKLFSFFFDFIWFLTFWWKGWPKSLSWHTTWNFCRGFLLFGIIIKVSFIIHRPLKISKRIILFRILFLYFVNFWSVREQRIVFNWRFSLSVNITYIHFTHFDRGSIG